MEKQCLLIILILSFFLAPSCIKEKDTEVEQPEVDVLAPLPCDTLYFGQSFLIQFKLSDNTGLGNISMDLHNNFGHHNHGAHKTCNMDVPKDPVLPYSNSWVFSLPENEQTWLFDTLVYLPEQDNQENLFDHGDYHFHIYVTDNEGYQVFTSLDVKILQD